jgi:hypothetical protein
MAIRSLTITLALLGTTPALAADTATSALPGGSDGRWFADQGDGTYRNPVLVGDWSDPDVIRHGDDYYLVASSFTEAPGLPILHSRDLVNWTLLGHALPRVLPDAHYATPRRGGGVWAPAIRFHDGRFLIYYPDPDHGIFVVSATDPAGPWTAPQLVDATPGAIDPAPFWDEDGTGWLVHAYALSRAGQANRIVLKRLDPTGTKTLGPGQVIIDGDTLPPVQTSLGPRPWQTTEGPKLYKRDGWYYIFAPSGSVKGGWQGVFRSRSITGPYEGRDVMDQGHTAINGPHQGPGSPPGMVKTGSCISRIATAMAGSCICNPCDGVPAGPSSAEILMATVAANLSRNIAFREQAEGPCSPRRARHWPTMIFREARSHQSGSLAATRSRIGPASTMAGCISSRSAVLPISMRTGPCYRSGCLPSPSLRQRTCAWRDCAWASVPAWRSMARPGHG